MEPLQQLSTVKRALLEIRELRSKLDAAEQLKHEPIAVIGMSCRFPGGANDPQSFWQLLCKGKNAASEVPPERWNIDTYYDPNPDAPGKMYTRWGAFINNVDQFDPEFFGISPREAASMDPQQRLLLELGWEALENAGQSPAKLRGSRTGIFIGISTTDYLRLQLGSNNSKQLDSTYMATGSASLSVASGRLAYVFDFQGPALSIDTACSSSLVAVHLASKSLLRGESRMALAGGVNLMLSPQLNIALCKSRMLTTGNCCKTFDEKADGYLRGEGCGVVVLKKLSDALADKDNILALIRGSAVNQDGHSNGLTAPNGPTQEEVIQAALLDAGLNPTQVNYVETHGTGTILGDPIEVQALGAAMCKERLKGNRLSIGSVKTNIGHLESAAGIASLIKVVLSLQNKLIPPHLHLKKPNAHIPWGELPIHIPTELTDWETANGKRTAGVSSFGFSGTNAHVIVEEAPEPQHSSTHEERSLNILCLSARSEHALRKLSGRYQRHLEEELSSSLANICFTANAGRTHFDERLAVLVESQAQAIKFLQAFSAGNDSFEGFRARRSDGASPTIGFLFSGESAEYLNMGRSLYETLPRFRKAIEHCNELLKPHLEVSLLSVLYPEQGNPSLMDDAAYAQPALFAVEYALYQVWRSWGVEPSLLIGYGLGEYVAACVAGVFTLQDALKLVAVRGRLIQSLGQKNETLAVFAGEDKLATAISQYSDRAVISAVNGPAHTVISGDHESITAIIENLDSEGVKFKKLNISHALQSPLVDPILGQYERELTEVSFTEPHITLISSVTGQLVEVNQLTRPEYWLRHLHSPVRFDKGIQTLHTEGCDLFLEIGPQPVLTDMGQYCVQEGFGQWLPSLRNGYDDWRQLLESLSNLYVHGMDLDWHGFNQENPRCRVALPTYPFERERYWLEESLEVQKEQNTEESIPWNSLVEIGRRQAHQVPIDLALHTYSEKWNLLDRLTNCYIASAIKSLGSFSKPDEIYTIDVLLETFKYFGHLPKTLVSMD